MNSFSTQNYKDDFKSFSEPDELSSIFLKCGNSGSAILPQGSQLATVFPIICLSTSHLVNSCIKFNFTSNIIAIDLVGTYIFQLYKLCDNQLQSTTVGPQWTFSRTNPDFTDISTFSFSDCDCDCDCDFCLSKECKYAVVMIPADVQSGSVIVTNATLSVIAVRNSKGKLMNESIIDYKDKPCFKPHLELRPAILKCGVPKSTTVHVSPEDAATVASVRVNTACFSNPCIKFEFASNILVPTGTGSANITFQIYKNCTNQSQSIPVGPPWTFRTPVATSNIFSFFVCDCNTCSDECCTYTVQAISTNADRGPGGDVTINSATLLALVVDNANQNC